ncbi:MAG: hypothetical protein ACYSSI_04375 [Planctomycetota bacterium]|jgi:hypothetical protein
MRIKKMPKRTSKLAIATLVIPVVMWGCHLCLLKLCGAFDGLPSENLQKRVEDVALLLLISSMFVGAILGSFALFYIKQNPDKLKGKRIAYEGMIIPLVLFLITLWFYVALMQGRP